MARQRITIKDLEFAIARMNKRTNSPEQPWTRGEDGKLRANIGNYHLSQAYGGASLHQMRNEAGGIVDVFGCGHMPKRELLSRIESMLYGMIVAEQ